MRFEPRHAFTASRLLPFRRLLVAGCAPLPPDLAFLKGFRSLRPALAHTVACAHREGVDASEVLLASGAVSESLYYRALARHLDLPFVARWPELARPVAVSSAIAAGAVRLCGDEVVAPWLLAPTGPALLLLLDARRLGIPPPPVAITTPGHLAALLRHRGRDDLEYGASRALPEQAPHLSAKGRSAEAAVLAATLLATLGVLTVWRTPVAMALGVVFLAGIVFRLIVSAAGLRQAPRGDPTIRDADLPSYSVLVPLYDEAEMVPHLLRALAVLDYPRSKLEVLILVEARDRATIEALACRPRPPWLKVVAVPDGSPRTKPRALNVGLALARGTLITVFDAEDRPQPDQLRRAAQRFAKWPQVACLQARLAIDNGAEGLLATLFAMEYAALFDVFNIGTARLGLPMALGGTSNHFRASALKAVGGWDAWNVTEDADLGLRLARFGLRVASLDSVTVEEAPTALSTWLKQRRRWTKGWMQTLIVLVREPSAMRCFGPLRTIAVALILTNLVIGPLLFPVFTALTVRDLFVFGWPAPRGVREIAGATLAVSVLVLGLASTLWCGYAGARIRRLRRVWCFLPLMVPYQVLISLAAWAGLWDLVRDPHHWHKTKHRTRS